MILFVAIGYFAQRQFGLQAGWALGLAVGILFANLVPLRRAAAAPPDG